MSGSMKERTGRYLAAPTGVSRQWLMRWTMGFAVIAALTTVVAVVGIITGHFNWWVVIAAVMWWYVTATLARAWKAAPPSPPGPA